jgi:hypothetical protein
MQVSDRPKFCYRVAGICLSLVLIALLTACSLPTRVSAEERLFLPLSLEFLGEYDLPKQTFQETPVGGLSGLTYDGQRSRFYAISDDRSQLAPARFYTLNLSLKPAEKGKIALDKVTVEAVTFLKDEQGNPYAQGSIDAEGIALSPRNTLFISSEGSPKQGIAPFIGEFNLKTGQKGQGLRIGDRYLPNTAEPEGTAPRGVQENLAFEALTLSPNGLLSGDPFRLFTATESSLLQDHPPKTPKEQARLRFLHYLINPIGNPILVAEHLYLLDGATSDTLSNGLSELTALSKEGYFLSLERTLSLSGFGVKIFQVVNSNATDTSSLLSLPENLGNVVPLRKRLLLDLSDLGIELDNLEGMTLGPRLPDGSQTLVLVSDDNFKDSQVTQFLLFRLVEGK